METAGIMQEAAGAEKTTAGRPGREKTGRREICPRIAVTREMQEMTEEITGALRTAAGQIRKAAAVILRE